MHPGQINQHGRNLLKRLRKESATGIQMVRVGAAGIEAVAPAESETAGVTQPSQKEEWPVVDRLVDRFLKP